MDTENMEVLELFDGFEGKVDKCINSLKNEFMSLKAGRANPHVLDKVSVEYYGTVTPIAQMANISVPEARLMTISVWDKSALKDVEKAIVNANLGLTPNNDGNMIRIIFPELNEERRKELVKQIKTVAENTKVTIRNARRDINDTLKKFKKDSSITEDDCQTYEKEVDKQVTESIALIDKVTQEKEKEVMSV